MVAPRYCTTRERLFSNVPWCLKHFTMSQIPWVGDFRPYFTIHDREYAALVNEKAPKAGLLLGVTNPFFSKTCSHWPHVLTLGGKAPNAPTRFPGPGPSPGWKTKTHKRYTSKDRQLLQTLETTALSGNAKTCELTLHILLCDESPDRLFCPSGRGIFQPPLSLFIPFGRITGSP